VPPRAAAMALSVETISRSAGVRLPGTPKSARSSRPQSFTAHSTRTHGPCGGRPSKWTSDATEARSAPRSPTIDADVREGRFRADLFRRLAVSRIDLPPLRDRREDVPALATRLLDDLSMDAGLPRRTFTQAALALLSAITWPGNLTELRGVIERVLAEGAGDVIQIEQVLPALQLDRMSTAFVPTGSLRDARLRFERDYIAAVLQHHGWRMADAAQTLGIQRPNLYRKARQLGIPLTRATE